MLVELLTMHITDVLKHKQAISKSTEMEHLFIVNFLRK